MLYFKEKKIFLGLSWEKVAIEIKNVLGNIA
jgi:hypothetical protein